MLAGICDRLSGWLVANGLPESERPVYSYGIQMAIETVLNVISTLLIGIALGQVVASMIFLAGYSMLRTYAGGFHLETALGCYIASCSLVACILLFSKMFPDEAYWFLIPLTVIAAAVVFILAPVPATHKPLDDEETVHYRKKSRLRLLLVLVAAVVFWAVKQIHLSIVLAAAVCMVALFMGLGLLKNRWYQRRGESRE